MTALETSSKSVEIKAKIIAVKENTIDPEVYVICVQTNSGEPNWIIGRRYSEFYSLRKLLKLCGVDPEVLNPFPRKRLVFSKDVLVIKHRKLELEEFLTRVLELFMREKAQCTCLREAFDSDCHLATTLKYFLAYDGAELSTMKASPEGKPFILRVVHELIKN